MNFEFRVFLALLFIGAIIIITALGLVAENIAYLIP